MPTTDLIIFYIEEETALKLFLCLNLFLCGDCCINETGEAVVLSGESVCHGGTGGVPQGLVHP